MGAHESDARLSEIGVAPEQLRVDKIDRAHIQGGRDADASAELDHTLDEIQADLAVVKAAVDMCRLGIDEFGCADGFGEPDEQCHRELRRRTMTPAQKVAVQIGKNDAHSRLGPPACSGLDPKTAS